jgi:hypothetical protein
VDEQKSLPLDVLRVVGRDVAAHVEIESKTSKQIIIF